MTPAPLKPEGRSEIAIGPFRAIRHDNLQTVASLWREMETTGFATAFQSLTWIKVLDQTLGRRSDTEMFVIEVRDRQSDRSLMLLPFSRIKRRGHSIVEFVSFGVCDLSMPVLAGDDTPLTPEDGAALWQAVLDVLPRADVIRIDQIPFHYRKRPNPLARLPGITPAMQLRYETDMTGDASKVIERLANSQTRRIIKTSDRRMNELGPVRFMAVETKEDLDRLFPVMIEQRRERFKELGRFDLLARADVRDFYEHAVRASLGGQGPVRMWSLFVGDVPIATCLGLVHEKTFTLLIITMAGGVWSACSPGIALLSRIIRWSRENDLSLIDFSVGDAAYKTGLGGRPEMLGELRRARTLFGMAILASERLAAEGKARLKAHPAVFDQFRRAVQFARKTTIRISDFVLRSLRDRFDAGWIPLLLPLGM